MSRADFKVVKIPPKLPPQITEHWNMYCVPIVLRQFSAPAAGGRFYGYFDFLPELYHESKGGSCLSLATTAVANAYITNLSHATPDRKELVQIYGHALRSTNAALKDPLERVKDSTIIAVWLLGIHELLISLSKRPPGPGPEAFHMHSEGLASLLCIRGSHQFSTKRGRNFFGMMYLFNQTHCFVANIEGPPESFDWFELLRPQFSESDQLAFAVSNYNYRISSLCPRILSFIRGSSGAQETELASQVTDLLEETDTLQRDIQAWNFSQPASEPTDLASLHIRNSLRAALLKLQYFIQRLLCHMASHSNPGLFILPDLNLRQQQCVKAIQHLSHEILNSLPLVLGYTDSAVPPDCKPACWAAALRLLWPLSTVS